MPMLPRRGFLASIAAGAAGLATKAFGGEGLPADEESKVEEPSSCRCIAQFVLMGVNDPRAFFCPCGTMVPTRPGYLLYEGVCKRSCPSCGRQYDIREDDIPSGDTRNPMTAAHVQERCKVCDPFWKEPPRASDLGTNAGSARRNQLHRQFTTFPMRLKEF